MSRDFPAAIEPSAIGAGKTIAIVASVYNAAYVDAMLEAAAHELDAIMPEAKRPIFRVPGAFEIPVVVSYLARQAKPDAILALGVVIQGATAHADLVGESVTTALQEIAVSQRIPVIHEVLLVEDEQQAAARTMSARSTGAPRLLVPRSTWSSSSTSWKPSSQTKSTAPPLASDDSRRDRKPGSRRLREAALKFLYACEISATPPPNWQKFSGISPRSTISGGSRRRVTPPCGNLRADEKKLSSRSSVMGESVIRTMRSQTAADNAREAWLQISNHLAAVAARLADVETALRDAGDDAMTLALDRTLPPVFADYRALPALIDRLEDEALCLPEIRQALEPLEGTLGRIRGLSKLATAIENPALDLGENPSVAEDTVRSLGNKQTRIADEQKSGQVRVEGIWSHLQEIDPMIATAATNYRLERIDTIDRCILRQAIYEMLHHDEIPALVAIDEAIELAKVYGSTGSAAFVNGILDRVLKEQTEVTANEGESAT